MNLLRTITFSVLVLTCSISIAQDSSDSAVGSYLPPKIRALLIQEMNAILGATNDILSAIVRGQDQVVAEKAQAIHDSFILKQEMTKADRKALQESVPPAFIERDRAFHQLSAQLAEAARQGNQTRQKQLFTQMVNACTNCHAKHATDRFPGLSNSN